MIKLIIMGILVGALSVVGCDTNTQQTTQQQEVVEEEFVMDPELQKELDRLDEEYYANIAEIDKQREEKKKEEAHSIENAQLMIKMSMNAVPIAPRSMLDGLLNAGYTEDEAMEAINGMNFDWNEVALKYGKYWSEVSYNTPEKLRYAMKEGWFNDISIDYTINKIFG